MPSQRKPFYVILEIDHQSYSSIRPIVYLFDIVHSGTLYKIKKMKTCHSTNNKAVTDADVGTNLRAVSINQLYNINL